MKQTLTRRSFTTGLAAGAVLASACRVRAQSSDTVVIASYGGQFQDAQRKALFEPFEKSTGIKVVEATGPSLAKVRTMNMSGNIEWDVAEFTPADFLVLAENNLLEKIDYGAIDQSIIAKVDKRVVHPYGVGALFYSNVIAFNTKRYPTGKHPKSWADVWDFQKFSGPRILPSGIYVVRPNEFALLAEGLLPQQLYPLDLERSYRSLSNIKPHVVKWQTTGAMAPQAIVDGEADFGMASQGRIAQLKAQGAPVDYDWNQGLITADYWGIPKGAKNVQNALKFIEFASRPEPQAELSKLIPYSPANPDAFKLLSEEQLKDLATAPDNLKKQVWLDAGWWAQKTNGKSNVERNIDMWNAWLQR
ncbi:ABC transporter substrate-binding protein (plasmid) [Sinorhizobium medicae]|uniref:Polyamine/opine ABC transporter, extracellular solute-binding protein component n=1 Tax=Rhizobium meliloti TaxID=382 RepID=I2E213_RHIML|nr:MULTISPECIES: ABC transporter substrate-binding protein [Sinorhizobium]AFJ91531.1 polyamine/opine ABC transporter, extracellular solute-binding protein component [Sinorhizobium meliloti]WQO62317.1 ABC transporter substrate-binding protein [Sinorhizobium medicae]